MPEIFSFDLEDREDEHLVRLRGELDVLNASRLRDALIEVGHSRVVVDLSDVSFIDSSGMASLLGARQAITDAGNQFVVRGATGIVRRVIELTGLGEVLGA